MNKFKTAETKAIKNLNRILFGIEDTEYKMTKCPNSKSYGCVNRDCGAYNRFNLDGKFCDDCGKTKCGQCGSFLIPKFKKIRKYI